jgi:hypothetical protein
LHVLLEKLKEVLYSVLPITAIVLILHLAFTPLPIDMLLRFLLGAAVIVVGLSIFLFGVDIGVSPLGRHIGASISRSNKVWVVAAVGAALGFFISVAEPDLQILAGQVSAVTSGQVTGAAILIAVSLGIAVMLVLGFIRIVYNFPLRRALTALYGLIFLLSLFVSPEFLAISFDASGATTGALAVPFVLALALGVSAMKKDSEASETDSFGLIAITSTGAIRGVLLRGAAETLLSLPGALLRAGQTEELLGLPGALPRAAKADATLFGPLLRALGRTAPEAAVALLPLIVIYIAFQLKAFKFQKRAFKKILKGFLYTFIGLVLFLSGVSSGFMDVGKQLGYQLALFDSKAVVIIAGFVIGLVTILAEPAVHILTDQIETVTSGYVKRRIVLAALALGVGLAVTLSILRILVPGIRLWHYLLPGYLLSVGMSFFIPKLFVGIAFDSGGVASGPMTATFILSFAQGVADAVPGADVLKDAFGMIALVAMTPILTLQTLGLIVKIKAGKKRVREDA